MLCFYFDKRLDDEPWSEDKVGDRFAGPDKARTEALEILREVARDHLHQRTRIAVRVRDDDPVPLLTLTTANSGLRQRAVNRAPRRGASDMPGASAQHRVTRGAIAAFREPVGSCVMLQTRPRNRLLAALPEAEWELLRPCLTRVDLKPRQVLQHPHTPVEYAYFVERGAVTFQTRTEADGPVGVGLVDGGAIIGLPIILGTMRSYLRALVEVAGEAYRISAADLRTAMDQSPVLHYLLLAYVHTVLAQSAQLVLCTSKHSVEQRLARWLLLAHDLLHDDLCVTHKMLSRDLGVRRASVSETMHHFQAAGLIRQTRACIEVADRAGLEGVACECYGVISRAYRQSLRQPSAVHPTCT